MQLRASDDKQDSQARYKILDMVEIFEESRRLKDADNYSTQKWFLEWQQTNKFLHNCSYNIYCHYRP